METKKKIFNKELVELKHKTLCKRINETYNKLKDISSFIECENEIKSIEIIKEQYERMYQAVLESEEYQKYEEIENTIIPKLSKIESQLDKYIYRIAQPYEKSLYGEDGIVERLKKSDSYRNFHNLDQLLEETAKIKRILELCSPYYSAQQQISANQSYYTLKFGALIRRQVEQMIYENGGSESWLKQYDDDDEKEFFITALKKMKTGIKKDDVLTGFLMSQIMEDNTLINHLLFRLLEQEIETKPEKYAGLLEAKVFNPHLCNIENDLFDNNIQYACGYKKSENKEYYESLGHYPFKYFFYRNRVNLSLLLAVLNELISEENTTIMECDKVYQRFGFKCRPIILNEGQEIIRRLYEKQRMEISQPQSECHSKFAQIILKSYDYEFEAKPEPFYTNAQIAKALKLHLKEVNALSAQDISSLEQMKDMAAKRNNIFSTITKQENDWRRIPLKNHVFYVPTLPVKRSVTTDTQSQFGLIKISESADTLALWNSYSPEFWKLGILIKPTFSSSYNVPYTYPICISLDDLGDLPIDYSKIHLLTNEEMRKLNNEITMSWSR